MKNFLLFSPRLLKHILVASVLEFGPVLIFIVSFEHFHIYKATIILMVATIISTVATFYFQKRLPYLALYVALLTSIFGYITLTHHQPRFIQIRDTLYDVTCAATLIVGLIMNVSFLKIAFQKVVPMSMRAWNNITYVWIGYFIVIAISNEYVRRTMTLDEWFSFKSVVIVATIIFSVVSFCFLYEKEK